MELFGDAPLPEKLRSVRDQGDLFKDWVACPDPEAVIIGLTELLVNAVEHGNLGITYEDKTALNAAGTWDTEVRRRLALPENASNERKQNLMAYGAELSLR